MTTTSLPPVMHYCKETGSVFVVTLPWVLSGSYELNSLNFSLHCKCYNPDELSGPFQHKLFYDAMIL